MIGGLSGCICNGGNGPSRVSEAPARAAGGPAAASASSESASMTTVAVAVDAHSPIFGRCRSASNVPRALWYSTTSLISWVFTHSHATANALASMGAEMLAAQRDLASASVIEYRTESTASAAGTLSSAACSSLVIARQYSGA